MAPSLAKILFVVYLVSNLALIMGVVSPKVYGHGFKNFVCFACINLVLTMLH